MMPASNFDFCLLCVFRARFTEQGPAVVTGWASTPKGALGRDPTFEIFEQTSARAPAPAEFFRLSAQFHERGSGLHF
jgi:hypothetical protein